MFACLRVAIAMLAMAIAAAAQGAQLGYEPVGLGWSADEVERVGAAQVKALTARAEQAQALGCSRPCGRLARVFGRLVDLARAQTVRGADIAWTLTVVRLPDIEAMAMPNGHLVISEPFATQQLQSDEALAFVMAHEMAHSILEHERQALTYARVLLPRQIVRSVRDMYIEMDYSIALLRAMEPVMQQGEYEADELGLLLASAAGYDPDRQLAFLEATCRADDGAAPLVATHPPACRRLQALQALLPLARRQAPAASD